MDVDRELAAALAVAPSPEFVARLRAHIAHAPRPVDHRLATSLAVGGGVVLAMVIAVSLVSHDWSPGRLRAPDSGLRDSSLKSEAVGEPTSDSGLPAPGLKSEARRLKPNRAPVQRAVDDVDALRGLELVSIDASYVIVERDARSETTVPQMAFELVPAIANLEGVIQ